MARSRQSWQGLLRLHHLPFLWRTQATGEGGDGGSLGREPPKDPGAEAPPPSCKPVPVMLSLATRAALKAGGEREASPRLFPGSQAGKGLTGSSPMAKAMDARQGSVMVQPFPPSCSGQLRGRERLDKPPRGWASKGLGAAEATPLITEPLLGCIASAMVKGAIGVGEYW